MNANISLIIARQHSVSDASVLACSTMIKLKLKRFRTENDIVGVYPVIINFTTRNHCR